MKPWHADSHLCYPSERNKREAIICDLCGFEEGVECECTAEDWTAHYEKKGREKALKVETK